MKRSMLLEKPGKIFKKIIFGRN